MKLWRAGLVAAVMAGVGCGGVESAEEPSPSATERYLEALEDNDNPCLDKECFDIERGKNISHIFLDFNGCHPEDFTVTVTTAHFGKVDVTHRLKREGGPCKELDADYRFELPGPDKKAKVCLRFHDFKPKKIRVGAKAANSCAYGEKANGKDKGKGRGHKAFEDDNGACIQCQQDH